VLRDLFDFPFSICVRCVSRKRPFLKHAGLSLSLSLSLSLARARARGLALLIVFVARAEGFREPLGDRAAPAVVVQRLLLVRPAGPLAPAEVLKQQRSPGWPAAESVEDRAGPLADLASLFVLFVSHSELPPRVAESKKVTRIPYAKQCDSSTRSPPARLKEACSACSD
jgi:hypothetical protein